MEILPIKLLTVSDAPIFGSLPVRLGELKRADFPVCDGIVVSPPFLKLKTILEHFDFKTKEVFEQTLVLIKKEILSIPVPEILQKETKKQEKFLVEGKIYKSTKDLWIGLLEIWIYQIKQRLWNRGFSGGITEDLTPQIISFVKKIESSGTAFFDEFNSENVIRTDTGKLHPKDLQTLDGLIKPANKKLFLPYEYKWIYDNGLKIVNITPFTQFNIKQMTPKIESHFEKLDGDKTKNAIKVFVDLSQGLHHTTDIDGVFIAAEKIYDLNKPRESFDNLLTKAYETALAFPQIPLLFKLPDKSEGMGKIRGTLRLLHQKSLLDPIMQVLDFIRHKKGITNVHIVIPFIRGVSELMQIKRELSTKKLMRKNSLKIYLELANPENLINIEEYLLAGIDGVVLNVDELTAHINGFDHNEEELSLYKNEVVGVLKFLEDGFKILHRSKIPILAQGKMALNHNILDFLVEKGIYGVIIERYEVYSVFGILHEAEKRMVMRKFS